MKSRSIIFRVALIIGIIFCVVLMACKRSSSPPPPPPEKQKEVTSPAPPKGLADLQIVDVRIEKSKGPGLPYVMVATVRNNGETDASGFNAGCEWDCPGGQVTHAGATIVQGGAIRGKSEFTYRPQFALQCAGPPTMLLVVCTVDEENRVQESNETNNRWSSQISIPH